MFHKLILKSLPIRNNMYNRRVFSSCNDCKKVYEIMNKKINILATMSFFNIIVSLIF